MLYPQFEAVRRKTLASILTELNEHAASRQDGEKTEVQDNHDAHHELKEGQAVELEVMQKGPLG
jgi:hypothetical protein